MKTITLLLTAIIIGLNAHADDTFVPSHRLAAELRFEAHRAGESFEDHTPALPPLTADTRQLYKDRTQANTDRRVSAMLAKYEQQYVKHTQQDQTIDQTIAEQINQLQQTIDDQNKLAQQQQDSNLARAAIGGGGLLAGAASAGLFFRRRKQLAS
jgi:hypothetical protein